MHVDDAWDAYRAQACLALPMWTPTLCPPATSLEMMRRITTVMHDHDVLAVA